MVSTRSRTLQYIVIILGLATLAVGGWWFYLRSQAGVRVGSALSDPLTEGLVGYWKLDDGSGTNATDASTNGNAGTLTGGPTWGTGRIDGAVDFDGTDDYITLGTPAALNLPGAMTACAWVYAHSVPNTFDSRIIANTNSGDTTQQYSFEIENNRSIALYWKGSGTGSLISGAGAIAFNGWYHLCAVRASSSAGVIYVNGAAQTTTVTSSSIVTVGYGNTAIGRAGSYSGSYFDGLIDEVRVYNRALSAEDVAKLSQTTGPSNPDAGLVGYWPLDGDDISGTTAYDRSGKGNNGTLTYSPTRAIGQIGQSLYFDGGSPDNDYIALGNPSSLQITGSFTISAWVKWDGTTGKSMAIFAKSGYSGSYGYALELNSDSRPSVLVSSDGTVVAFRDGSATLSPGRWSHVVGVYDSGGQSLNLYLDGVQINADVGTVPAAVFNTTTDATIGAWNAGASEHFPGNLDEIRVYNRALPAAEIVDQFRRGHSDMVNTAVNALSTMGEASVLAIGDSGNGNLLVAQQATLSRAALLRKLSFYVENASGHVRLGVYDATGPSGGPGAKLAETAPITVSGSNQWYTAPVITPVTLSAGTYWLAYLPEDNVLSYRRTSGVGAARWYSYAYGPLPATYSASPSSGATNWSFYATLEEPDTTSPETIGLVGHWTFDGTDILGTTTYDHSGNGRNGTLSGGIIRGLGKLGQALSFDGSNGLVTVSHNAALDPDDMTLTLWMRRNGTQDSGDQVFGKPFSTSSNENWSYALEFDNPGTALKWEMNDSNAGTIPAVTSGTIPDNTWVFVTATYKNSTKTLELFINGTSQGTTVLPGTRAKYTGDIGIGNYASGGGAFKGSLDDIRLYNRVLTAGEIAALSNKKAYVNSSQNDKLTTGLAGLWSFDGPDIAGTTAYDRSPQGKNGTLTNGPTRVLGKVGQALDFDGVADLVDMPADTLTGAQKSISAWIRPRSAGEGNFGHIVSTLNGGNGMLFSLCSNDATECPSTTNTLEIYQYFSGADGIWNGGPSNVIKLNEWNHVVVTYDSGSTANDPAFYVNGVLQTTTERQAPTGTRAADGDFLIGANSTVGNFDFDGYIDEVRAYNRILTLAEVSALYAMGK